MYATRMSWRIRAPRTAVYRALTDPAAIARWRVPDGMSAYVHLFDARPGGAFRISLTYDQPSGDQPSSPAGSAPGPAGGPVGKSGARTDTYRGRFLHLVPDEQVVEELAFETDDPALHTTMTITTTLSDADTDGQVTVVHLAHDGIPDAIPAADNESGTRMALARLAALVEGQSTHP
ncbi:SRPBCC domain-containing protein [Frankia sp. R82]|uniref:SRPBCC domain-containing protein n=1 Tax=Frankia sp. R82 TaxID=2950553 RepID=UPI00204487CB|nr:SRPBCC domain-containing protein [Frankia sp. R82]MCM3883058.1 SRPBCC domain-containing protein [Frankia sp. R82]